MSFWLGGHTAIVRRWIAHNPFGERHDVALLWQPASDANVELTAAVRANGGAVHALDAPSLCERAAALRRLAWETADVVVSYAHPWDVVPTLAFAAPGGPPVLHMNHADHAFWVGAAAADLVVDIRDSGLALSRAYRGARGSALLPVPLLDRGAAARDRSQAAVRLVDATLADRGLLLLTVGSSHKYRPQQHLDFPAACRAIVEAIGDCTLVAVGPLPGDSLWHKLALDSAGRIVPVGPDRDLASWHAAADLYLESFPIGSYTALLEAGLAARAFVRKPHLVPPSVLPLDRGALAAFEPPATADDYVADALALAQDLPRRAHEGEAAGAAILASHCGEAWAARLAQLQQAIPDEHGGGLAFEPPPMPEELRAYWANALGWREEPGAFLFAQRRALENRLKPRVDGRTRCARSRIRARP